MKKFLQSLCLALFFSAAALAPAPVRAIDCEVTTNTADLPHWLAQIADMAKQIEGIFGILNFIQDLVNTVMPTGFSRLGGTVTANTQVQTTAIGKAAQFTSDTNRLTSEISLSADIARRARVPAYSVVCPNIAIIRAYDRAQNTVMGINHNEMDHQSSTGYGPQADCNGPSCVQEAFDDLCQLGFFHKADFGDLVKDCADTPGQNVDKNPDSLFSYTHLKLPARVTTKPDGFRKFAPAADDEKPYAAAYKYCENLQSSPTTPVYGTGRTRNTSDVLQIMADRHTSTLSLSAKEKCITLLGERTMCPSGSTSSAYAVGMGETCFDNQKTLCHAYKDPPPNGRGWVDLQGETVLADCDSKGFSLLDARHIWMFYHCKEAMAPQHIAAESHADDQEATRISNACVQSVTREWQDLINQEHRDLDMAIQSGLQTPPRDQPPPQRVRTQ